MGSHCKSQLAFQILEATLGLFFFSSLTLSVLGITDAYYRSYALLHALDKALLDISVRPLKIETTEAGGVSFTRNEPALEELVKSRTSDLIHYLEHAGGAFGLEMGLIEGEIVSSAGIWSGSYEVPEMLKKVSGNISIASENRIETICRSMLAATTSDGASIAASPKALRIDGSVQYMPRAYVLGASSVVELEPGLTRMVWKGLTGKSSIHANKCRTLRSDLEG